VRLVVESEFFAMTDEHFIRRRKRVIGTTFWIIAVIATALAWSGLSLKAIIAAIGL